MPTVALTIHIPDAYQEFLIAELTDLDFEAFEMEDELLVAYVPSARWDDVKREHIESWLNAHEMATPIQEEILEDRNWERQWEETVGPVVAEPFLIKPTWREVPSDLGELILLEIDPKMSFGTGYHESTRLILRLLPEFITPDARVLDAGTGTGILAIASVKLGASDVVAFDIDPWSQRNAVENVYINGVQEHVSVVQGAIDDVATDEVDLVLANINLNVTIGLLADFAIRLRAGGRLVASGILTTYRPRLLEAASRHGFTLVSEREEGEWWAGGFSYGGLPKG